MDPQVAEGQVLAGRYRLGPLLGRGGMAEVYDGFDTRLARPVAIKLLRADVAANPAMRQRFEQEARSAARLSHPNVVSVYDSGEDGDLAFLVMERLPGRTLADRIARGPLAPSQVVAIALDVLAALDAAHGIGLVHRDIKPGNILLTEDGRAKVADYGIAKSLEIGSPDDPTRADLTQVGLVIGTPAYLAPERFEGVAATAQSDLYALGVVMYEALTGRKPVAGGASTIVAGGGGRAPDVAALRPEVPAALAAIVRRALAGRPQDRYGSAAQMRADLQQAGTPTAGAATMAVAAPTHVLSARTPPAGTSMLPPEAGRPPAAPTRVQGRAGDPYGDGTAPGPYGERLPPDEAPARSARRALALLVALVVVAAAVAAIVLALRHSPTGASGSSTTAVTRAPATSGTTATTAASTTTAAPATTTPTTIATTTVTTVDSQAQALDQAAANLLAAGTPGARSLGQQLQAVAAQPAGPARTAAAQTALDQAGQQLQSGAITSGQYQEAAAALEGAGATAPATPPTAPTTTASTTTAPTTAAPGPPGPGATGKGHHHPGPGNGLHG